MKNQKIKAVPLLDLQSQLTPLRAEIMTAVKDVIDSTQYIMGPKVEELENSIAEYSGVSHAVGVSSGTDALLLALMALDIGPGDLVITSNFSFFATAGVVARLNATPVFVDIDPVSFNLSPKALGNLLSNMKEKERKKVKAVIPVHLYGQCAEMSSILSITRQFGIPVIEDAAQAIGAEYLIENEVKRAGSLGSIGCFSFFPSKNLGGIGDGGMIVTSDDEIAKILKLKRVHGESTQYHHEVIGGNFRMDPIQAAVLTVKLQYLNKWHQERQKNAEYYSILFQQENIADLILPQSIYSKQGLSNYHIFNQYVIRTERRNELQTHLAKHQIAARIYYPIPFHLQPCFQSLGYQKGDFPESEKAAQTVLALPVYPELTDAMQEYVVEKIVEFFRK
ncbi:MAG: DegT/DnrJ/EryC1/StrS family aminotransferase [SAR324 cluster bacterium]|nr:DegT/DnrJ/EryC1/StrS family aminotransferase [SAR324 cluster bacterium]